MSPLAQSGTAAAIGATSKIAQPLINNPISTAGIAQIANLAKNQFQLKPDVAALQQGMKVEAKPFVSMGKPLTESKIKEYLKKAKNNPDKARASAIKDGYDPSLPYTND
jgi:hypothetical protein